MPTPNHITECGLPGIRHIPYGLHACHFYAGEKELADALVPYFLAGLRSNERCLWITAAPLPAAKAFAAIEAAWPDAKAAVAQGRLRILDFSDWYTSAAGRKGADIVRLWLEEEARALAEGYAGLRITGNVSFLHDREAWGSFMEYEKLVTPSFAGRRIVALCSYELERCDARQTLEVLRAHNCSFDYAHDAWQVLSSPAYRSSISAR